MKFDTPDPTPSPEEASASLRQVEELQGVGLARGIYPRWFCIACPLWAGLLAASLGTALMVPILFAGILGYWMLRNRTDAWVEVIQTPEDVRNVALWSVFVGGVYLAAYAGLRSGRAWAPIAAGVIIALVLFLLLDSTYLHLRGRSGGCRSRA